MTPQEQKDIHAGLNLVIGRTTDLNRASLRQKAWIQTLSEAVAELISKQTGNTTGGIILDLEKRQKAVYQKLLDEIENTHPAKAGELTLVSS